MAEVAAAASAAGLASLGIQCCKGLTTYYNSCKAYDEQIGAVHEQIQVLTALFEMLKRVLSRNAANPSQASSLQQVDGILNMCLGRLQTLQVFLETCQSVTLPNSTAVLLQKIKARALFPFKEKTLLTLRENVQSLRDDIQFALSVLQIDLEMEQNQTIASLATVSRNVEVVSQTTQSAIQAMATPVHRMDTRFDLLLQQGQNTTTRLSEMQAQARHYHEAALDLYRHVPEQCRQLLQRDQIPSQSLEQDLITALGQFGTERELLGNAIRLLNHKREGEAKDLAMRMDLLNENIMKLQLGAISRPSLLPSADRQNGQLAYVFQTAEPNVDAGQGSLYNLSRRRMKCNCDAKYTNVSHDEARSTRRFGWLFGHAWIYRSGLSSTKLHRRTCPMLLTSPAVVTARLSIGICGALLRGVAEATFSITRGAGGFSISRALHCMRVVDGSTKTFRLAASLVEDCPYACRIEDWEYRLNRRIQEIECLFREGQATPYDVDLWGNTLLHVVGKHLNDWRIQRLGEQTGSPQEVILRSLLTFCENLHNLGVPLNWYCHEWDGQRLFVYPLILMPPVKLDPDVLSHSLTRLCQMGLELTSSTFTPRRSYYFYGDGEDHYREVMQASAFQKCDDVINVLCNNELHAAVLSRSEPHLRAALQRSHTSIDEPNETGHTPLHLASNWPCGLSLLLAHGADMEKTSWSGFQPVEFAITHGCTEGVELLLKAGCSFDSRRGFYSFNTNNIFAFAVEMLAVSVIRFATLKLQGYYFEVVEIIIKNLALRQDSISENSQILTSGNTQAETSYRSLRGEAPLLRNIFPGMHVVYHCQQLTVKVANVLWEAGFREVDLLDDHDRTPLMLLGYNLPFDLNYPWYEITEFAFWLYQKGASLYRPCRDRFQPDVGGTASRSERRVIHSLAAAFKRPFEYPYIQRVQKEDTIFDDLSLESRQIYQKVLQNDSSDNCLCACSRHGCIPATCFLKCIRLTPFSSKEWEHAAWWRTRWFWKNVPPKDFPVSVSREIIRLRTFERLGLRHTCCDYEYGFFKTVEPAEADEIRDEDRDGIQLLESLLPEFEEKLADEDIKSFIDGYWSTRMEEVLAARDEESVDKAGIREAGVILCDDDGSDEYWI